MLFVGLTGGIGAGKSTVAAMLRAHGAAIIDADVVARAVVVPGSDGLAEVVAAFGRDVLAADGTLDRARLASVVFVDAGKRARLNAIVHPRVRAETRRLVSLAPPDAIVVNDVPLLVEVDLAGEYDVVVVVEASLGVRLGRLAERGIDPAQARRRIAAQATDEQRRAVAWRVIANDGSLDELAAAVDDAWQALNARRHGG